MSQAFVTTGRIEKGELKVRNRRSLDAWSKQQRDGEYTVTIERAHATRSLEQNKAYWAGFVKPLSEHTGYTPNELHAYLKSRFLPTHKRQTKTLLLHNRQGEVIDEYEVDLSTTTTLNRVEFGEYLHDISVFAAELGVTVGSSREGEAA